MVSEWLYLKRSSETSYSGTDSLTTTTEYYYDNLAHLQPTRIVTTAGNPSLSKVTATIYPLDYTDNSGFIKDLKDAHFVSLPIEQITFQQDLAGNNQKILKGSINTYKPGNLKGLKDQVWELKTNAPVSYLSFKFSNKALGVLPNIGTSGLFAKDAHYQLDLTFNSYDQQNRPVQLAKTNDQPIAMIWSKDGEHLLAQVINVKADQIFHTSFEEDGTADINAKTGSKSHAGNYTIPTNKEPVAGTYILTYWERQNGLWKYKELQINYQPNSGPIINTYSEIDEVRLYPVGSSMTTYTYKPLVGITSVCDLNNLITYYFYDEAGRLSYTQDDKGNILQKYDYKYTISQPLN